MLNFNFVPSRRVHETFPENVPENVPEDIMRDGKEFYGLFWVLFQAVQIVKTRWSEDTRDSNEHRARDHKNRWDPHPVRWSRTLQNDVRTRPGGELANP